MEVPLDGWSPSQRRCPQLAVKSTDGLGLGSNQHGNSATALTGQLRSVQIGGLVHAIASRAADHYSLALKFRRDRVAWGRNREGELGNGTNAESGLARFVSGLSGVIAISRRSRCWSEPQLGAQADGTVWAWATTPPANWAPRQYDSNVPVRFRHSGPIAVAGWRSQVRDSAVAPERATLNNFSQIPATR